MRPTPAAISRKGQICVSAHRLEEATFPDLINNHITPAAINNNGPNKALLYSIISFFLCHCEERFSRRSNLLVYWDISFLSREIISSNYIQNTLSQRSMLN